MPDESHLLAVEKSVTAHKGGLQQGIVVSLKGRRGRRRRRRGWRNLLRNFYRFVADLPAAHYQCTTTTYMPGKSYFPALSGDLHFSPLILNINETDSHAATIRFPSIRD